MERLPSASAARAPVEPYRQLIDAITDYAIYSLDRSGIIISWNPGAERFKGYRAEEVLGRHVSLFYTPEDQAAGLPEQALATAAASKRFEGKGWRVRKDGSRFYAHVILDPIHDAQGELIGFAKVTRDITDEHQTEKLLAETREELFLSQKMEAIGQVTSGAAHDFNNLLSIILGSLQILRKQIPQDPQAIRMLDNAIHGVHRGTSLTRRMLTFARRQPMQPTTVDIAALVGGMLELLRSSVGPSITLQTQLAPGMKPIWIEPNQLELALLNLCTNARDAMPDGGLIIVACAEQTLSFGHYAGLLPGEYICLSLQDTGHGMDEATLAQSRTPMFTTKPAGKGTGLGLAMVQNLVSQYRGHLHIESRPGAGTRIELWLPVAKADETPGVARKPARPLEMRSDDTPLRILVVDDDDLVLFSTVALLEDLGHTVLQAASGQQALDIVRDDPAIDLLITDYAMPQMSGLQLANQLQEIAPHLPLIVASGYAELPVHTSLHVGTLIKPFSQEDLSQAIAESLTPNHK